MKPPQGLFTLTARLAPAHCGRRRSRAVSVNRP
jgi:hypothetical protein